jgi:peptide/nickel transport system ATP-binding protein
VHTERDCRSLLQVRELTVSYCGEGRCTLAVENLSFDLAPGEILGIQGRSGCGKTSTALALLKLLPQSAHVSGAAIFAGLDLLQLSEAELRNIRGRQISIIHQEPAAALNPVMRVGKQIEEVLRAHHQVSAAERKPLVNEMLERVQLSPGRFSRAYPHELSGGERHRVVLAQALICRPALVIADEPTAGLDFRLKSEIVDLMAELRSELQTAFLLISHDARVISRLADRKLDAFADETNFVSRTALSMATPSSISFGTHPTLGKSEHLLVARRLRKCFRRQGFLAFNRRETQALDAADIAIPPASIVGLIGASGSGKSTLARCLALLESPDAGEIRLAERNLLALSPRELRTARRAIQYVPQDPAMALNPRFSAAEAIEEPLLITRWGTKEQRRARAVSLMESVGLDSSAGDRSCQQFSGGQKQRLVIARALAVNPKLLIFDESLSGLDPGTQREMIELMVQLKAKLGISQLLISHDLDLVHSVADSVVLMSEGRIVEANAQANSAGVAELLISEHFAHAAPFPERVLTEVK